MKTRSYDYYIKHYRSKTHPNKLVSFHVVLQESDLFISADSNLSQEAASSLYRVRLPLELYIKDHPGFLTSLNPMAVDDMAPPVVRHMLEVSHDAGVGPMASVAGAVADFVGKELLGHSRNIIVENGGDIFIKSETDVTVGIFAGKSPLSERILISIKKEETPVGISTSSGTIGSSLSFGRADAACVMAETAALADAVATAVGNRVKTNTDIEAALGYGMNIKGVRGVIVIVGNHLGVMGSMRLTEA
jgi:uncharacterized protein